MKSSSNDVPSISADEAETLLAPYAQTIAKCFEEAWQKWLTMLANPEGSAASYGKTTRANIVNDLVWAAARARFMGAPDVHISDEKRMLTLCIADRFRVRFKKLDKRLRSSNIPTAQQKAVAMQLSFDGLGPLNMLTVGYVLDKLETAIEKVVVTMMKNKSLEWYFEISKSAPMVVVMQHSAPLETPARTRRVKIKKTAQGRLRVEVKNE